MYICFELDCIPTNMGLMEVLSSETSIVPCVSRLAACDYINHRVSQLSADFKSQPQVVRADNLGRKSYEWYSGASEGRHVLRCVPVEMYNGLFS